MFDKVKKNFGFGCMRLPMDGDKVDYPLFCRMIDAYMEAGFNYFDTAHGYIDGKSETAIRDCLVPRYPRESYVLANKLSDWFFETKEDVIDVFESQLALCGVEYFDFYLFHCLNRTNYEKHLRCDTFGTVRNLKGQGKVRHIAMSFHDTADVLDRILTEQPYIEAVQLQINYLDYDDPSVQSKACYDVAVKHGKKVIVMEPVRGGALVNLPEGAKAVFDRLGGGSYASYALRYAAGYPEVFMVLSGMGDMHMVQDNVTVMGNFVPLSSEELAATDEARRIIREAKLIPCTGCNYCAEVCPMQIPISGIFAAYNEYQAARMTAAEAKERLPREGGSMGDCIGCGACEKICPQVIPIPQRLRNCGEELK